METPELSGAVQLLISLLQLITIQIFSDFFHRIEHHNVQNGKVRYKFIFKLLIFHRIHLDELQFDPLSGKVFTAVKLGAADGVDKQTILKILAANGAADSDLYVIPNTLSMNCFRFDALLHEDREHYASVILNELDRDYLYMLRNGATTFWETIKGAEDFSDAGSLCHGWSALPIYYYEILS